MTNNEIRNSLTEHQKNYKLCNLNLMSCYGGLYPATLTKLSLVIFNQILSNKMYYKKESKFYSKEEDRRIYTNVPITPVTLLENCHPVKYRFEGKDSHKDSGNIVKRINELDDNNIFYVWKCGYPRNYMFVLERDVGLWKFYNPNAYVTPKTLRKILLSTNGMRQSMHKILVANGDKSTIHDVSKSFCEFVSRMITKAHPDVQAELDVWGETRGYKEYLTGVNDKVKLMAPYEGLIEDPSFQQRLPLEVKSKLVPSKPKKKKDFNGLESVLTPKEGDLVAKKKPRRKRKPVEGAEAKFETFKSLEPFKNATSLFQYYKTMIKSKNSKAKFHEYQVELSIAAQILDSMKSCNQDEEFFKSWILFFVELRLKGNNAENKDKTSLRALYKTYEEYNGRYIGVEV